ncbi:MAG: hypothetical protein HW414_1007 [Dehalococcoidia bacterium]|nr:hypothetical protein [Dehalococcoidia bacterium]
MHTFDRAKVIVVRGVRSLAFWLVLGAVVGVLFIVGAAGRPAVGLIKIPVAISSIEQTQDIVRMMKYSRDSRDIRAVVLQIDSPGGSAVLLEEIYLALTDLRRVKPVVTTVDTMALSGGYLIGVAADSIYVKPTSMIGNIGVWMSLQEQDELTDDVLPTGPYKLSGLALRDAAKMLEMVKEGFVGEVMKERGDRLKMTKEDVSQGKIYLGLEGVKLGLADKIGSTDDAIAGAAKLARVANYSVVDVAEKLDISLSLPFFFFKGDAPPVEDRGAPARDPAPRFYYLYPDSREALR